jgi:hypothetical protein
MTELQQSEARLAKLIEDMSGSIQAEVAALETKMEAGFDRIEAATRRNTSTLAGGAAAIAALNRWAARRDTTDRKRDTAIHKLEVRVSRLERTVRKHK